MQPANNRPQINQRLAAIVAANVAANVAQSVNINMAANNQLAFSNVTQQNRWQVQQEMAVIESLGKFLSLSFSYF